MFNSYQEAQNWIASKSKEHGGKGKLYASAEYREMYPEIMKAYEKKEAEKNAVIAKNAAASGFVEGEKVKVVVAQHLIFGYIYREGTLTMKDGVKVVLDESYVAPGKKRGVRTIKSPKFKKIEKDEA